MHRGLRQGDPLSPFLFVLVAKVLNKMVSKAKAKGIVEGLLVGKKRLIYLICNLHDTILFYPTKPCVIKNTSIFWIALVLCQA